MTPRPGLILVSLLMTLSSVPAVGTPQWMAEAYLIGDVYTYGEEGTLAVFLKGVSCRNQKDYFFIGPSYVNNASQLIAMVLAAKAAGQRVRFFEDTDIDAVNCYVRGVRISD